MTFKQKLLLGLGLSAVPMALAAQSSPTDPAARAPAPRYESAFEGYRPYKEEPIADWRAVNEEVGKVGGHAGIFGGAGGHAGHRAPNRGETDSGPKPSAAAGQQPARSAPKAPGVQGHAH